MKRAILFGVMGKVFEKVIIIIVFFSVCTGLVLYIIEQMPVAVWKWFFVGPLFLLLCERFYRLYEMVDE